MALKRSSLAFLLTVVVALIAHGPGFHADAAPIDRLLALIPSSSTFHSNDNQQQFDDSTPPPQPSLGRAQIRPIGGHAVLDDDDDDAGNELLDTESDGLLRPDADDEVEGTIEGEVLEEEEDDDEEEVDENETYGLDEDKEDVGSNDDAAAGDIYEPWETTLPPVPSSPSRRLTHREVARRTRLARMREGNEESL
ncbi:hypothetical protein EC991_002422 [Linnemannia zychae]|nr:hypothetical protein EC991_002422 [Linnemannia zychae]